MDVHIPFMRQAIQSALAAEKNGEVPIGAVLVDADGKVLSVGQNRVIQLSDPTAHAEIEAVRTAAEKGRNYRLLNTTLYVTIEPCVMCMGAILHARIKRLVFGLKDPKWGVCGSIYDLSNHPALNHRVEVVSGVCEEEIKSLIQAFFQVKRKNSKK